MKIFPLFRLFLVAVLFSFTLPFPAVSQDARDIPDALKDSVNRLKTKGIQHAREGNLEDARKMFLEELNLRKKIYPSNHPGIGHAYVNLGVVHKMQGKLDRALEYYDQADRIYSGNPAVDARKIGTNYQNMANIYSLQKDYEKAKNYYHRAEELFLRDSVTNRDRLGMVYNNLGIMMYAQRKHEQAIFYYQKSIQLKKTIYPESLPTTYGNLANVYSQKGDLEKAENLFHQTIQLDKQYKTDSYSRALDYMNYGLLKLKKKRFLEAEQLFDQSLQMLRDNLGENHIEISRCYENLGFLANKQGHHQKALSLYQKALLSLSGNFSDTSFYSNPDIDDVLSKTKLLEILKRKAATLGRLPNHHTRNLQAALNTYNKALEVIQGLRTGYQSQESKLLLTANERETYLNAMQTAIDLYRITQKRHYLNEAFRYAESSKAAVLYEAMQTNQALKLGDIPDSLRRKENQLKKSIWTYEELIFEERKKKTPDKNKLDYWNQQMFQLQKEYEALVSKFEQEYPDYYALKYNQEVLPLPAVQRKIKEKETLIEYVVGRDSVYSFAIKKHNVGLHVAPVDSTLQDQVVELRNALSNRNFSNHRKSDFDRYQSLAYQLYQLLVEPIELKGTRKITFIPDDVLSYIPFEVLVTEHKSFERIQYDELAYLIHEHQVSYSYSAKVLYNHQHKSGKQGSKLAAYAPTYNNLDHITDFESPTRQQYREKLYPLKGIKKEAQQITNIIRGDVYSDYEATEATFKRTSDQYDILHLAMHTLVNDQNPMYSKMAFTQQESSEEDGFLNTYEIYSMNLNSRMAVLSSCNTGSGKLEKGEGVISLARGFKYAGCPSIVMTMWPVEDNSSIRLMEYFYKALNKGKSKDNALRTAKLKFLENSDPLHSHPYFWAGYILIGDKSSLYTPVWIWWAIGIAAVVAIVAWILIKKRQRATGASG
jgi:CHAT domain-containing protein/Tfp pilus assembly protein PilF